jgi:hypothetical protein
MTEATAPDELRREISERIRAITVL